MATAMLARMLSAPDREDGRVREETRVDQGSPGPEARWRRWALPISIVVLAVPFAVAVLAQLQPRWYPVLDLAMTELRVRDVFTTRTPLVGLPGRIGEFPDQGSHPGPLSFYALAPLYRLLGSSSWALQAATAAVNLIACGLALWIARRRGGLVLVAAILLMLAVLLRGYGMETFIEPWNPLMPLLWWVVLLLAVWSVLCGDIKILPVAVVAASFCAQTHVPYVLIAIGVGALGALGAVLALRRTASRSPVRRSLGRRSLERRSIVRWVAGSVALGVVLWTPPLIDQLRADGGNVSMLVEHFASDPPEAKIGLVAGVDWLLVNLNPWSFVARGEGIVGGPLVTAALDPTRSPLPGALLVAVWAAAVVIAARRRQRPLLWLHAVIATGLVLGTYSLANVFGKQWYYLTLWSWALAALMVGSIAWTAALVVRDRLPAERAARLDRLLAVVMFALAVVVSGIATVGAIDDDPPDPMLSAVLGEVIPPTAQALDEGVGAAEGRGGRYLVAWSDAYFIGSQGFGLVSELERLGFDVGVVETYRVPVTRHRVLAPEDATAEVHLVTGFLVDEFEDRPDAVEVARTDPRSPEELEEFERLRGEIVTELRDLGLDDLVPLVDENLFGVPIDPRLPVGLERKAFRLLELGQPTAVFILPAR